jgi:hypothetical protein
VETIQVASAEPPAPVPVSTPAPVVVPVVARAEPVTPEPARPEPARAEQPASYDVASLDDDEDFSPHHPNSTRVHARDSEAKVVMRFTPLGGSNACGSLRNVAGACQVIDHPADHPGRS